MRETPSDAPRSRPPLRWPPAATAVALGAAVAAVMAASYADPEGRASMPALVVPATAAVVGTAGALFQVRRLMYLLAGLTLGVLVGAFSSVGFLGQPVERLPLIVGATMTFYLVLGTVFGGFVEFVRLLDHLAHGGKLRDYPLKAKGGS